MKCRNLIFLFLCFIVSGCGESSNDDGSEDEFVTFTGKVLDENSGLPLSNATIYLKIGSITRSTSSDNLGQYSVNFPKVNFPRVVAIAIYTDDDSFLPQSYFLDGEVLNLDAVPPLVPEDTFLSVAGAEHVVLRRTLGHVGDDSYDGNANSQLQIPTMGASFEKTFTFTDEAFSSGGDRFFVTMKVKGAQCAGSQGNLVTVARVGELTPIGDPRNLSIGLSDSNGGFTSKSFLWNLSSYSVGDMLRFTISSSPTCSGDFDDFEFIEVVGEFQS